ncbi:hypothetical protein QL285_067360 [Trifolium repens]|nr:hypothetical protein QL285_067360 [Trifolium repens]
MVFQLFSGSHLMAIKYHQGSWSSAGAIYTLIIVRSQVQYYFSLKTFNSPLFDLSVGVPAGIQSSSHSSELGRSSRNALDKGRL